MALEGLRGPKEKINKWGGFCPKEYSFNSRRYRMGECTEWEFHLYASWYNHGADGMIGNNNPWREFGIFYKDIQNDPEFENFKKNPSVYNLDKDFKGRPKGSTEFSKENVMLVYASDNMGEMLTRCRANGTGIFTSKGVKAAADKKALPITLVEPDGTEHKFGSAYEAEKSGFMGHSHIHKMCESGKKVVSGQWKGWGAYYG